MKVKMPQYDGDGTLSILVHAPAKVGKSTFASTAPSPVLVLDAEGGWRFIRKAGFTGDAIRKKFWDPSKTPPPRYDGTWNVCIVTVRKWQTILLVNQWLQRGQHDFRSIILDSITEVQRRCKANLVGDEQMRIQDWGTLLNQMDGVIRGFRDIVLLPDSSVRCVVFIAETGMDAGKWRPAMQGQIRRSLPYWVDICGFLFTEVEQDANGQNTGIIRKLLISPHQQYECGERVQGILGSVVTGPNISNMLSDIFGSPDIQECITERNST